LLKTLPARAVSFFLTSESQDDISGFAPNLTEEGYLTAIIPSNFQQGEVFLPNSTAHPNLRLM
jgi:hypothetical protein